MRQISTAMLVMVVMLAGCTQTQSPTPSTPPSPPPIYSPPPTPTPTPAPPSMPPSPPPVAAPSGPVDLSQRSMVLASMLPTIEAGMAKAQSEQKSLVLILLKSGCGKCAAWDGETTTNGDTIRELSRLVVVHRNYDGAEQQRYQIVMAPAILFYTYDQATGSMVFADVLRGPVEQPVFQRRQHDAAAGKNRRLEMFARLRADRSDEEAWYALQNDFLNFLTTEERRELQGLR